MTPLCELGARHRPTCSSVKLTATDSKVKHWERATVYLSFTGTAGGGQTVVNGDEHTSALNATPQMFVTDEQGNLQLTYTTPHVLPNGGTDSIVAQDNQDSKKSHAKGSDTYTFASATKYQWSGDGKNHRQSGHAGWPTSRRRRDGEHFGEEDGDGLGGHAPLSAGDPPVGQVCAPGGRRWAGTTGDEFGPSPRIARRGSIGFPETKGKRSMKIESSVTSVSWIPSEAVTGVNKAIFESGVTHTSPTRRARRPRPNGGRRSLPVREPFAGLGRGRRNDGRMSIGPHRVRLGKLDLARFAAVKFEELRAEPEMGDTSARFVQTFGGHVAPPAPRTVNRPPFVKFEAPTVWTTIALTLHTDGRETELVGASPFPRHSVLRQRGQAHRQGRARRFQGMVAHVARQALALGRFRVARARDRRSRPRSSVIFPRAR